MLKDITLGQFFPGTTIVHRLDPRTKLVLLVVELIRGKPLDPKYEGYINLAGFVILFGLMIVVTVSDVTKLFG